MGGAINVNFIRSINVPPTIAHLFIDDFVNLFDLLILKSNHNFIITD